MPGPWPARAWNWGGACCAARPRLRNSRGCGSRGPSRGARHGESLWARATCCSGARGCADGPPSRRSARQNSIAAHAQPRWRHHAFANLMRRPHRDRVSEDRLSAASSGQAARRTPRGGDREGDEEGGERVHGRNSPGRVLRRNCLREVREDKRNRTVGREDLSVSVRARFGRAWSCRSGEPGR